MKLITEEELEHYQAQARTLKRVERVAAEEAQIGSVLAASDSDLQYERGTAIMQSAQRILKAFKD